MCEKELDAAKRSRCPKNDKMSKKNRSFAPGSVPRSIGEDGESGLPGSADEQVDTLSGDHHQHQHQRLPERVWTNMPILFQVTRRRRNIFENLGQKKCPTGIHLHLRKLHARHA